MFWRIPVFFQLNTTTRDVDEWRWRCERDGVRNDCQRQRQRASSCHAKIRWNQNTG